MMYHFALADQRESIDTNLMYPLQPGKEIPVIPSIPLICILSINQGGIAILYIRASN